MSDEAKIILKDMQIEEMRKEIISQDQFIAQLEKEKDKEIDKLNLKIHKLKREIAKVKRDYKIELKNNSTLVFANTRLVHENKYLKRDLARIPKVLKYIDSCKRGESVCSIRKIRDMLVGTDKEDLEV